MGQLATIHEQHAQASAADSASPGYVDNLAMLGNEDKREREGCLLTGSAATSAVKLKTLHDINTPYGGKALNIVTNSSLVCAVGAAGVPTTTGRS